MVHVYDTEVDRVAIVNVENCRAVSRQWVIDVECDDGAYLLFGIDQRFIGLVSGYIGNMAVP